MMLKRLLIRRQLNKFTKALWKLPLPIDNLNIIIDYDKDEDMYYVYHNIFTNLSMQESFAIMRAQVKYLDSKGIFNYTFRYNSGVNYGFIVKEDK